jgi:hypothetical protein
MAEEWKLQNPTARNPRRARELMALLRDSLFGVDINPVACRITAFSLYLAYLDQLSPRDIHEHQEQGRFLPNLIATNKAPGNIRRADFFDGTITLPSEMDLVLGNPPWGSTATDETPAGKWCASHGKPVPDKQIAAAFVWKAADHIVNDGRVCFLLPDGIIFNSSSTALEFQRAFITRHSISRVLNLADFRWFLFERAVHAALVVAYRKGPATDTRHKIEYWVPKTDWAVIAAEVITIAPTDRSSVTVAELLQDLASRDAPQIWKQKFWASPRDLRLLDRLSLYPRLRDHVRGPKERNSSKPWVMAVGFQPVRKGDDPTKAETISLPSKTFIPATTSGIDLFLLPDDCKTLNRASVEVRSGSNKNTEVFHAPHVLVAKGFTRIAFCDFDVSFQDALRGIHGPIEHRSLLIFLAAYLRSSLAAFYLFHTASDWGITRPQIHVDELLRVPFPLPDQQGNPKHCWQIVKKVAGIVDAAARKASGEFVDRQGIIQAADAAIAPLMDEYFDIHQLEKPLIEDTVKVTIPSIQPTRKRMPVPTVVPSTPSQREAYSNRVCALLNGWGKQGEYKVHGAVYASDAMGVGMTVLEKTSRTGSTPSVSNNGQNLLKALDHLRKVYPQRLATLDVVRGLLVFDKNRLYVVKPISQRHWTQTAAMNDADEIAGTILMRSPMEGA